MLSAQEHLRGSDCAWVAPARTSKLLPAGGVRTHRMKGSVEDNAMTTIRIRKQIDSETLYLPELKPLLGRTVEIAISGISEAACCAEAGQTSERDEVGTRSANQAMLNAIAEVARIQAGMQPKDDNSTLTYLREARSGAMYGYNHDD
jgi:hypothetical protein